MTCRNRLRPNLAFLFFPFHTVIAISGVANANRQLIDNDVNPFIFYSVLQAECNFSFTRNTLIACELYLRLTGL